MQPIQSPESRRCRRRRPCSASSVLTRSPSTSMARYAVRQRHGRCFRCRCTSGFESRRSGRGLTPRMDWAAGLFPGFFPDVAVRRTRMPVRRTSPSTQHGEMTERPADVPLGDGDSDRDVAQPRSDFTAGRRSRFRFVPGTDRHLLLLLSADVPWLPVSSGEPTQHPAFSWQQHPGTAVPSSQRRQHSRCEAPLCLTLSRRLRAINPSAHCRALTQLNFTQLGFSTPLPHTAKYVRSLARSTLICRLSRNFFVSPVKTCASPVSTQSPDLTDSHKADLSGHARTQAATAYRWRQKINTSLRVDPFTMATPLVKVHAKTWRAVLTIAASL